MSAHLPVVPADALAAPCDDGCGDDDDAPTLTSSAAADASGSASRNVEVRRVQVHADGRAHADAAATAAAASAATSVSLTPLGDSDDLTAPFLLDSAFDTASGGVLRRCWMECKHSDQLYIYLACFGLLVCTVANNIFWYVRVFLLCLSLWLALRSCLLPRLLAALLVLSTSMPCETA